MSAFREFIGSIWRWLLLMVLLTSVVMAVGGALNTLEPRQPALYSWHPVGFQSQVAADYGQDAAGMRLPPAELDLLSQAAPDQIEVLLNKPIEDLHSK